MRNATGLLRYRADRRPSRKSTSTTSRRPVRVGQRSPAAPAGLGHRGSPRTGASCSARTLRTPLLWKRSLSAGSHLDRRRAVGQVHRVGHRDEYFARSLEALPAVRGADVVHKHQVASLPPLACGRSEEHTSELQSRPHLVCRLLLEKKKEKRQPPPVARHARLTQMLSFI